VGRPAARPLLVGRFRSNVVAHYRSVVRGPDRRDVDVGEAGPAARLPDRRSLLNRLARPPHHKFRLGVPSSRFLGARVERPWRGPTMLAGGLWWGLQPRKGWGRSCSRAWSSGGGVGARADGRPRPSSSLAVDGWSSVPSWPSTWRWSPEARADGCPPTAGSSS